MHVLATLVKNPFLIAGLSAWAIAQMVKAALYAVKYGRFDITRLFGDGGMPSGHCATVSALAMMCALKCGVDSVSFAVSCILAVIVCHDALGVRKEVEKHAVIIQEHLQNTKDKKEASTDRLKCFVGHTPVQVAAGVGIGLAVSCMIHAIVRY